MFLLLVVAFTVVPVVELYILLEVGRSLGLVMSLLLVVGTGVLGAQLARYEGWRTVKQLQENLRVGIAPTAVLFDGALILGAGVLLITPGIATDICGFLLLIPALRLGIRRWAVRRLKSRRSASSSSIEVEFDRLRD